MSVTAIATVIFMILDVNLLQNPSQQGLLSDPPPTILTRQVPVAKQVVVTQKKLVSECVLVCPPGLFRRPYYTTQYRLIEEQKLETFTEMKTVTEVIQWNGTAVYGSSTIINLPTLSGVLINEVFGRMREIMILKNVYPANGNRDARTSEELFSSLTPERNKAVITSSVFESSLDPSSEFQFIAQSVITYNSTDPTTNQLMFRLDVRSRPKGSRLGFSPANREVAKSILSDLFMSFPYKVAPN